MNKKSINLLQEKGKEPTLWEKIYIFVTNTTRIIVIITEVLVLGAFGWRFYLDRQLNDLKESVTAAAGVLKSQEQDEFEIRKAQEKFLTYDEIWTNSSNVSNLISNVGDLIPSDIVNESVTYNHGKISISGRGTVQAIQELENNINQSSLVINKLTTNYEDILDANGEETGERNFNIVMDVAQVTGRSPIINP